MSRTIKTRVWDEDSKEFVYISQTDDGSFWVNDGLCTTVMPEHGGEPEQYTGLKDKNGVEICEGDILDCKDCDELHKVVWFDNRACFDCVTSDNKICISFGEGYEIALEVIGNIHETPELLEDKR